MKSTTINLRNERSAKGGSFLIAVLTEEGDLRIEGQDLGDGVEEFWGTGNREYEWNLTVRALHLPRLTSVLGGHEGGDVLSLLASRYAQDPRCASRTFLEEHGVPVEFWSRVGD